MAKKKIGIGIGIVAVLIVIIVLISSNKKPTTYSENTNYNTSDNSNINTTNSTVGTDASDIEWQYEIAFGSDKGGISYRLVGEDYETYEGSQIRMGVVKSDTESSECLLK